MKKLRIAIITLIIILASLFLTGQTYAATMNLNIQEQRPFSDDDGDGTVGNDKYTITRATVHTVFRIGEKTSGNLNFNKNFYCLRAGLGFGNSENITNVNDVLDVTYTDTYNLKTQASNVMSYYSTNFSYDIDRSHTETIGGASTTFTAYNAILWLVDNMFLAIDDNQGTTATTDDYVAADYYGLLMQKAGILSSQLTYDDIEVIQQMVLWYFANYDTNGGENSLSLSDTSVLSNLLKIKDENFSNDTSLVWNKNRAAQMDQLYTYLIEAAKVNANKYGTADPRQITTIFPTIQFTNTNPTIATDAGFSIIGPLEISIDANTNLEYKIDNLGLVDGNSQLIPASDNGTPIYNIVTSPSALTPSYNSLKETIGQGQFYIKISNALSTSYNLSATTLNLQYSYYYYNTKATLWLATAADQPVIEIEKEKIEQDDEDNIIVQNSTIFDLSLRKFISAVNGNTLIGTSSRAPEIDTTNLKNGTSTTSKYTHSKTPLYLKRGDKIVYTIRVYNEGNVDGIVSEITDYLPEGLDLAAGSTINTMYGIQKSGNKITSTYLQSTVIKAYDSAKTGENATIWQQSTNGADGLYYADIQVECVIADSVADGTILRNIAEITEAKDKNGNIKDYIGDDIDSTPDNVDTDNYTPPTDNSSYQEDDDDYERVVVQSDVIFDLSLRKFITNINGTNLTGTESRVPQFDTSGMNFGKTTATYTHSKEPIIVKQGDIVTYTIRVYNEGETDGYVQEITDCIPEGLGYLLNYKTNTDNGWRAETTAISKTIPLVGTTGLYKKESDVKNLSANDFYTTNSLDEVNIVVGKAGIYSTKLEDDGIDHETLIKAYNPENTQADIATGEKWQKSTNGTDGFYYQDIEITCIVLAKNTYQGQLRNIAEVTDDLAVDDTNTEIVVADRDSTPDNVDTDNYTPPTDNSSYQEDDDDYELLELKYFDLALRKFITGVNSDDVTTRIPEVKVDSEGKIAYEHDKTPVCVANSDLVIYTIRVYNEGAVDGYAEVVADDIPEGVEYLPDNDTNKEYSWKMYDKDGNETTDIKEAVTVATTYLSEVSGMAKMTDADTVNPNLLKGYSPTEPISADNPDYLDLKIVFKVTEEKMLATDTTRIITNYAQIAEDKAVDEDGNKIDLDDEDSTPSVWIDGEDDQDVEHIYVKCFDLALFKWVTKTIVTVDGKTTTTETGFKPNQGLTDQTGEEIRDNSASEPIAAVVIDKKKINSTTVKFAYTIKVINEGEIDGQVREITDYIPEGLEFIAADNPLWTKVGDNKITTNALDGLTLKAPVRDAQGNIAKPGESATVEVIFTWINSKDNLGLKTNIAEITEDYNEKGSKDVDSTPDDAVIKDYDKEQQDDDDFAQVILSLKTGGEQQYILLIAVVVIILLGGTILIKKYVL